MRAFAEVIVAILIALTVYSYGANQHLTFYSMLKSVPACYIAAFTALMALVGNIIVTLWRGEQDYKNAYRKRLAEIDAAVGGSIYELVACCQTASQKIGAEEIAEARQREEHFKAIKKWMMKAGRERCKIEEYRSKGRYVLYGIDEGFRALTKLPNWLMHYEHERANCDALIAKATSLRKCIDSVILRCYKKGAQPSKWDCWRVVIAAKRMRKQFKSTRPSEECD